MMRESQGAMLSAWLDVYHPIQQTVHDGKNCHVQKPHWMNDPLFLRWKIGLKNAFITQVHILCIFMSDSKIKDLNMCMQVNHILNKHLDEKHMNQCILFVSGKSHSLQAHQNEFLILNVFIEFNYYCLWFNQLEFTRSISVVKSYLIGWHVFLLQKTKWTCLEPKVRVTVYHVEKKKQLF